MIIDYRAVGLKIKWLRLYYDITQEELAFRIGTSSAYLSCVESGKKKPSLQKLLEIADALGVTLNDLLYAQDENSRAERGNRSSWARTSPKQVFLNDITGLIKKVDMK